MAAKVCGICTSMDHLTNMCPTLQEIESDQPENVGAIVAWKTANSARTESGALYSSTTQVHTECISKTSKLSIANSAISNATFPTVAIESAYSRQLSIFGRPDETTCN
ncbi:hypothetical protein CR513_58622, partial [Mucuna pruriens]